MAKSKKRWWTRGNRSAGQKKRGSSPNSRHLAFESLEDRRMLSTITWVNRGLASDGFDTVFGASAAIARADADAAFDAWERVIQNFNNGTNNINIALSIGGVGLGGSGGVDNGTITNGRPTSGTINLAGGNGGIGGGYYLDPTPYDSSEFDGDITNAFAGNAEPNTAAANGLDFFTLVALETTHVLGTSNIPALRMWTSGLMFNTDIQIPDGREEAGPGAGGLNNTYWLFNGTSGKVLFNGSANTGNPNDLYNAVHSSSTTDPPVNYLGTNYYGAEDVANGVWAPGERYIPSTRIAGVFHDAYGYTINDPTQFGTFYDRLDANGTLEIRTPTGNSNDTLDLQISGGNLLVTMHLGAPVPGGDPSAIYSVMPITSINNIKINMGDGSDTVSIHPLYNSIPITLDMGVGTDYDILKIYGGAGYDSITVDSPSLVSSNGINITSFSGIDTLDLYTNGGDADIYMPEAGGATLSQLFGSGSGEHINLHSLSLFTPLTIHGNGGDDTITIDPLGGIEAAQAQVSVYGDDGNDTLILRSNDTDLYNANITFDGGPSGSDQIIFDDAARSYNIGYNITPTFVTRSGLGAPRAINYTDTEGIVVNAGSGDDIVTVDSYTSVVVTANGNGGDDNFIIGGGLLASIPGTFIGGDGADTITFNDSQDFATKSWDIANNQVGFGSVHPLVPLDTTGFESVAILAGINEDTFNFSGGIFQSLYVDGNYGSDTFTIGANAQAKFFAPVTLLGGVGDESFVWQNGSNNWFFGLSGTSTYPVTLDGGPGLNSLSVNDTTRTLATSYQLYEDRFYAYDPAAFPSGADFNYHNIGAIGIALNNLANNVDVYSVSSDIDAGQQVSIALNGGNDLVTIHPHDAEGNRTINGNLGIGGGGGSDTLTVDDTGSSLPINYSFYNQFGPGTTNIGGLGAAGFGAGADLENITVNAGDGDDTFDLNSFKTGSALAIHAGDGDDTLNFGNDDLAANVTSLSSFLFDGQQGFDRFNLNNGTNTSQWQYVLDAGTLRADRLAPMAGYTVILNEASVEESTVNAGPDADAYYVRSVDPWSSTVFNAGDGLDGLVLADSTQDLSGIQGPITYNSAGSNGNMLVSDNADTRDLTAHLTTNSLGASPGDNLFGPGGSLYFDDVIDFGAFPGITLNLGSGVDTIYAQPLASARVEINAGNPTTAPGDTLNLSLITAENYAINGTPASGNVTSDNLMTLSYTGFETGPTIVSADFDGDGDVDGRDFLAWQRGFSLVATATHGDGDANNDMVVDGTDLVVWQGQYGTAAPLLAAATAPLTTESAAQTTQAASTLGGNLWLILPTTMPISASEYRSDSTASQTIEATLVDAMFDSYQGPISAQGAIQDSDSLPLHNEPYDPDTAFEDLYADSPATLLAADENF